MRLARKWSLAVAASVITAGAIAPLPGIAADGRAAICDFYNHGDYKKDRSGPCRFDEDSDEVRIKMRDGKSMRFIPEAKRKGHFVDQDGNRLDVQHDNDYKRTYRWKNQRLIVQVAEP